MLVAEVSGVLDQQKNDKDNFVVVESFLDSKRGSGATLIVCDGTLKKGMNLWARPPLFECVRLGRC